MYIVGIQHQKPKLHNKADSMFVQTFCCGHVSTIISPINPWTPSAVYPSTRQACVWNPICRRLQALSLVIAVLSLDEPAGAIQLIFRCRARLKLPNYVESIRKGLSLAPTRTCLGVNFLSIPSQRSWCLGQIRCALPVCGGGLPSYGSREMHPLSLHRGKRT